MDEAVWIAFDFLWWVQIGTINGDPQVFTSQISTKASYTRFSMRLFQRSGDCKSSHSGIVHSFMMCSRRCGAYQVEGSLGFSHQFREQIHKRFHIGRRHSLTDDAYPCSSNVPIRPAITRVMVWSFGFFSAGFVALVVGWLSGLIAAMVCIWISDLCPNEHQVTAIE